MPASSSEKNWLKLHKWFVLQKGFSMSALTRTSLTQPFANPNAPAAAPILPGFRTRPLSDCKTLVGTCQSGCSNEQICTYTAL